MSNDDRMSRREALATLGGVAVAGVAGCVGGDGGGGSDTQDDTGDNQNTTGGPTDSGTNPDTNTRQNNTDGDSGERQENNDETGLSRLLEEPEELAQAEKDTEEEYNLLYDGWIEVHNPSQDIPLENLDMDRFPGLKVVDAAVQPEDYKQEEDRVGPYRENDQKMTYLLWKEEDGRTELALVVWGEITNNGERIIGSKSQYQDSLAPSNDGVLEEGHDTDVEGILRYFVEHVDDVSEDIDDRFAEILLENEAYK